MGELPALESRVQQVAEIAAAVQAALDESVLPLPLTAPPAKGGPHLLSLHLRSSSKCIVLVAEPMGEPSNGRHPLRLRPSEVATRASLEAFMEDVRKKERAAQPAPAPAAKPPPVVAPA